ncbi:MAG: uroporphyrinogen decarboxylase (URO-D) [Ruminococcaceae bacterium]|nr:uroporphyrinogen decarboxylase (URO-D) [Oscillospiraceae bacterium]
MLNKRENFLETIRGGKPDRFVKQFEGTVMVPGDPVNFYVRGQRFPGMEPKYDRWGTRIVWPEGEPGAVPDVTVKVLDDVTTWREVVKIPDLIAGASAEELWGPYIERAMAVNRDEDFLMMFAPTGVFERLHFLMGFEDTLCNFLLEPEAMEELCAAIGEYRYNGFKLMVDNVHPDVMLTHDDWGSKQSLFIPPDAWREMIKPAYKKSYDYLHDNNVIIMHHADSFCEDIVEDMVDLHIDIWQGVLPQNDILKLQKQLNGRMALMGGIDAAVVDRDDSTEEEIRSHVRYICENFAVNGSFIPCITYGGAGCIHPSSDVIIDDEIARCSAEFFNK